jgi:pimeloyl-ACP methyl ester carboxylesterase
MTRTQVFDRSPAWTEFARCCPRSRRRPSAPDQQQDRPRTVVTYDPRGSERSSRTDGATVTQVEEHAYDLHRLIEALDAGEVDSFASSGGATNALALVERHPEQVRTLIAFEPPAAVLPDREAVQAAARDIRETYLRSGVGPGMAKFMAFISERGPIPLDYADRPDPARLC